jgi:RimJ/RimL family protein N-acetyltransferase
MILTTPRLILRDFVPQDADALALVISDAETMRYYPAPFDHAEVEAWITRNRKRYLRDGHGLWAMCLKESGELIGDCGLIKQVVDNEEEIEIGYHVRLDHWRKGYASEAAQACREFGFKHLNAARLISLIRPENLPSQRVAEKNGMRVWKEALWHGLTHRVYAIERTEWQAKAGR